MEQALHWITAAGLVTVAAGISWLLAGSVPNAGLVMLFLVGTVVAGLRLGGGPAAFTAIAGGLTFNYLFTEPRFSFRIHDVGDILTFAALLSVGMVVAQLVARARSEASTARESERQALALSEFTSALLRAEDEQAVAATAAVHLAAVSGAHVDVRQSYDTLTFNEAPARRSDLLVPCAVGDTRYAMLVVQRDPEDEPLPRQIEQLIEGYASQVALGLERIRLLRQKSEALLTSQAEEIRNSLLAGLSHDLRTPLASILGSASALLERPGELDDDDVRNLTATIHDETLRMHRLVSNLLEMASLTRGISSLKREWIPLEELIGSARNRLAAVLHGRVVTVHLPPDLPPVWVDGLLYEQLLQNLLENAAKYTPHGTPIEITATVAGDAERPVVQLSIMDRGPGIPAAARSIVFEKFTRLAPESARSGLGLGLALCRSIALLHGSTITVTDRPGGGAIFTVDIPAGEYPTLPEDVEQIP